MEFRTTFEIQKHPDFQLDFGDKIVLLGSCFSDRIGAKLAYYGLDTLVNPFGTVFHPLNLAKILDFRKEFKLRTLEKDGSIKAYELHSSIYENSSLEFENRVQKSRQNLENDLKNAKVLILTFGTSFGHYLNEELVANCHKQPGHFFQKRMSTAEEMIAIWSDLLHFLQEEFPKLNIMFTVSPVRHTRDGMVENSLSKARLLELVHAIPGLYFPAYELMMDDLRDYRFYESDMIHPNNQAVDYIFQAFSDAHISPNAQKHFAEIHRFRMFEAHQVDRAKYESHLKEVNEKRELLKRNVQGICLG